jgi:Protein of unknown function (DUF1524)
VDQAQREDFPFDTINAELRKSGRKASFDDDTIETILSLTYGKSLTFLALSLLYDDNNWGSVNYHQDHIFPQALFTPKHMSSIGLNSDQQKRYLELMNRVGNLELLLPHENLEKSNQDFESWLATRDRSFRKRHLIPDDDNLLSFDKFEEFIAAREELIRQRLKQIFAPLASQASDQSSRVPHEIYPDRQLAIHRLLYQLVDERTELELDICDEEVVRFGLKDWDVPVLKAGMRWPPSGRILLFTWVNRKHRLNLQLGLGWGPEGTDTREKLFPISLHFRHRSIGNYPNSGYTSISASS